jgi:hypothetical protein
VPPTSLVAATYQSVCFTRSLHAAMQDSPVRSGEWAGNARTRWSLAHRHGSKKPAVAERCNSPFAITGSYIRSLSCPALSSAPNPAAVTVCVIFLLFLRPVHRMSLYSNTSSHRMFWSRLVLVITDRKGDSLTYGDEILLILWNAQCSAQYSQNYTSGRCIPCSQYFLVFRSRVSFPEFWPAQKMPPPPPPLILHALPSSPSHLLKQLTVLYRKSHCTLSTLRHNHVTQHTPFTQYCTLMHTERTLTLTCVYAHSRPTRRVPAIRSHSYRTLVLAHKIPSPLQVYASAFQHYRN